MQITCESVEIGLSPDEETMHLEIPIARNLVHVYVGKGQNIHICSDGHRGQEIIIRF